MTYQLAIIFFEYLKCRIKKVMVIPIFDPFRCEEGGILI